MSWHASTFSLLIVIAVCTPAVAEPEKKGFAPPRAPETGAAFSQQKDWAQQVHDAAAQAEKAGRTGHAIALRDALIRSKNDDVSDAKGQRLARRSLYLNGASYQRIGWHRRAAEHYERYAKARPGRLDAALALQHAIDLRVGLGQHEKAKADAALFRRAFRATRKQRSLAAAAHFSLAPIVADAEPPKRIAFYRRYLKLWAKVGGRERAIIANVRIALELWRTSCPSSGVDGLCIEMRRSRAKVRLKKLRRRRPRLPTLVPGDQCGRATKAKVRLLRRKASRARAAIFHFRRALGLAKRLVTKEGAAGERKLAAQLDEALAAARFRLADRSFERSLALPFPRALDFFSSPRRAQRSQRALERFIRSRFRLIHRARWQYERVVKTGGPHWSLAISARLGQLRQRLADQLSTAPIPKAPAPPASATPVQRREFIPLFREAYCDALLDKAFPIENKAMPRYGHCLARATKLGLHNRWAQICAEELAQLRPEDWPLPMEIVAQPGYLTLRPAISGLRTRY